MTDWNFLVGQFLAQELARTACICLEGQSVDPDCYQHGEPEEDELSSGAGLA